MRFLLPFERFYFSLARLLERGINEVVLIISDVVQRYLTSDYWIIVSIASFPHFLLGTYRLLLLELWCTGVLYRQLSLDSTQLGCFDVIAYGFHWQDPVSYHRTLNYHGSFRRRSEHLSQGKE